MTNNSDCYCPDDDRRFGFHLTLEEGGEDCPCPELPPELAVVVRARVMEDFARNEAERANGAWSGDIPW